MADNRRIVVILGLLLAFAAGWGACSWYRNNRVRDGLWTLRYTADDMLDAAWAVETGGAMSKHETKDLARALRTYSRWIRKAIQDEEEAKHGS